MLLTVLQTTLAEFFATYLVAILIVGGIGLIIQIVLLVNVYKDAKEREENEVIWFIIVFCTGIFGWIIIQIVKGNRP